MLAWWCWACSLWSWSYQHSSSSLVSEEKTNYLIGGFTDRNWGCQIVILMCQDWKQWCKKYRTHITTQKKEKKSGTLEINQYFETIEERIQNSGLTGKMVKRCFLEAIRYCFFYIEKLIFKYFQSPIHESSNWLGRK